MNSNSNNLPSWKFRIKKLGCLESGDFEVKPLTLLCGPNNTGKTWAMYALYGFLDNTVGNQQLHLPGLEGVIDEVKREGVYAWDFGAWIKQNAKRLIDLIHITSRQSLHVIFNAPESLFLKSEFNWSIQPETLINSAIQKELDYRLVLGRDKNDALRLLKPVGDPILQITLIAEKLPDLQILLSDMILRHLMQRKKTSVFLIPAERNGLHLFFRELSDRRTTLLHHAARDVLDISELFRDVLTSRYAKPIADYIDWLNLLRSSRKSRSDGFHGFADEIKRLAGGRYDVDGEGNISFTPKKIKRGGTETPKLDLHMASSTVKSLFGLWFYLEHQAENGDVIMIDEPELNLHPANQRALARVLVRLVNAGLRVVVSTHSDYIVREINNLIMLHTPFEAREELAKKFQYEDADSIGYEQVGAYLFNDATIKAMEVVPEEGIIAETFDEVIHSLNESSNDIFYAKRDSVDSER